MSTTDKDNEEMETIEQVAKRLEANMDKIRSNAQRMTVALQFREAQRKRDRDRNTR